MRREDAVERLSSVLLSFRDTPHEIGGELVTVAASGGVAQHGRDGVGFAALYRAADGALRIAKASGRGRVRRGPSQLWTPSRTSPPSATAPSPSGCAAPSAAPATGVWCGRTGAAEAYDTRR